MSDAIRLVIPRDKSFFGVARMVVGGLAVRLDLSYEHLEDLQLALESVLEGNGYKVAPEVAVEIVVRPGEVEMRIGPLDEVGVRAALERERDGIALGRLLSTLVESVSVEEELDGKAWLSLTKKVPEARTEA